MPAVTNHDVIAAFTPLISAHQIWPHLVWSDPDSHGCERSEGSRSCWLVAATANWVA